MFSLETLLRINDEGAHILLKLERRELAIQQLENRLGVTVDRTDPMLGAMAAMEMSLAASFRNYNAYAKENRERLAGHIAH